MCSSRWTSEAPRFRTPNWVLPLKDRDFASNKIRERVTIRFHFAEVTGPGKLAAAFDYIEAKPVQP